MTRCRLCGVSVVFLPFFKGKKPYEVVNGEYERHHCVPIHGHTDPIIEQREQAAKVARAARGRFEIQEEVMGILSVAPTFARDCLFSNRLEYCCKEGSFFEHKDSGMLWVCDNHLSDWTELDSVAPERREEQQT